MSGDRKIFPDLESLARAAAESIAAAAGAVPANGTMSIALSGGDTPAALYRLLAGEYRERIPWQRTHFFWGDERWVPHDSPKSNYRMARETLLDPLGIPAANIHPIPTDLPDPETAALAYEEELRLHFKAPFPTFDILLLGMGDDGHTASLFPGIAALSERRRGVVVTQSPVEPATRITLTFPALERSRRTIFLIAGEKKRPIISMMFEQPEESRARFPAAMLSPAGELTWMLDREAYDAE
ncbi:MAG: pgl [Chlorobi bacterium]|nr:pgl [Chlorobiota bacterium]